MYRLSIAVVAVFILAGGSGAVTLKDEMHSNLSRGNRYYEAGDHEMALERYREAQGLDSTFAIPHFNAGDALYRMGNYRDGALEFLRSSSSEADSIKAMSYYNLGNTMFKAGDLQSAVEAYKRSLLLDPEDADAKYNLELALKMREQQEQQQQDQDQQQDRRDQEGGEQDRQQEQEQQDQEQQQQDQQDQQQQQQEQQQPQPGEQPPEISPEELERILAAIEASDKETQEEMMKKASQRKTVTGKDW